MMVQQAGVWILRDTIKMDAIRTGRELASLYKDAIDKSAWIGKLCMSPCSLLDAALLLLT